MSFDGEKNLQITEAIKAAGPDQFLYFAVFGGVVAQGEDCSQATKALCIVKTLKESRELAGLVAEAMGWEPKT